MNKNYQHPPQTEQQSSITLFELRFTELFLKAVELLGSDQTTVRIGGLYGLERIAQTSSQYQWQIAEVLTNYVKERSILPNTFRADLQKIIPIKKDIQIALKIISTLLTDFPIDDRTIDLSNSNLNEADLSEAHLNGIKFTGSELKRANFSKAQAVKVNFSLAYLNDAILRKTNLQDAILIGSHLERVDFSDANLVNANLSSADLERAKLMGTNLSGANLINANLSSADLEGANLKAANLVGAYLFGTNLQGTNLEGANLRQAQLNDNFIDNSTDLLVEQIVKAQDWQYAFYSKKLKEKLPF